MSFLRTCFLLCLLCLGPLTSVAKDGIEKISFQATEEISRADFYIQRTGAQPQAALVLAPGQNGNGRNLIKQQAWQDFARQHNLLLVGVSLASPYLKEDRRVGYFYAERGAGDFLIQAVRQASGQDLPLLLYGFSGGAHFASRFAAYQPDRVIGYCAYSASWWDPPVLLMRLPPGLIACGDHDGRRFGPSLMHFKKGRALGLKWSWITFPETGHGVPPELPPFARAYFAALLDEKASGCWVDIGTEEVLPAQHDRHPALTAWLPDRQLYSHWRNIHEH